MKYHIGIYIPIKIAEDYGSIRIRAFNLKRYLAKKYKTEILDSLNNIDHFSHIVLPQKAFTSDDLTSFKKNRNTIYIYDVCEFFIDEERKNLFYETIKRVDIVTVASYAFFTYLRTKIQSRSLKIFYIPDIVEVSFSKKEHRDKDRLNVFWYGFKENLNNIQYIIDTIKDIDKIDVITMSDSENADYRWDIEKWEPLLETSDIGISPIVNNSKFHSIAEFKSSHKITSFMAKGIPVVVSPVGEYKNILKSGINGFIANSFDDWKDMITKLKNTATRSNIGEASYNYALKYSGDEVVKIWNLIFDNTTEEDINIYINEKYITYREVKLHLGCGSKYKEGYINIDYYEFETEHENFKTKADQIMPLHKLTLPDNFADLAETYHTIEHLYKWEAEDAFKELYRVLKFGGKVIIECPDLAKCCKFYLENPFNEQFGMWGFYGDPGYKNPAMTHKWGYTFETIKKELEKVGFKRVSEEIAETHYPIRDLRVVAFKDVDDIVVE